MKTQRKQFVVTAVMAALVLTFLIAPIAMAFVPGVVGQAKHSVATKDVCPTDGVTVNLELTGQSDPIQGGKDIVLVIDESGSMSGTPYQLAQQAASEFVELMDFSQDRAAVISFSHVVRIRTSLTNDKQAVLNAISQPLSGGDTAIGDALQAADNVLTQAGVTNGGTIVLLTDGNSNTGADPVTVARQIKRDNERTIFAIGLGDSVDDATLVQVAGTKQTDQTGQGADYYYGQAQVPQQLADIYNRIHNSIYYVPAATNITIVEHVADNVTLIPDSFAGFGTANYSADGKTITITLSQLANGANKFSYQVSAPEGNYAVVKDGNVTYTDPADGQQKSMAFTGDTTVNVNAANCGAPPNEIPEPTTILLLGSGLAGLAGYVRRKRNHA